MDNVAPKEISHVRDTLFDLPFSRYVTIGAPSYIHPIWHSRVYLTNASPMKHVHKDRDS